MSDLLAILDQLEEARAKATPGPWRWDPEFGEKDDTGLALTNGAGAEIIGAYNTHCCAFRDDPTVEDADAALIVAAVNAAPKLTAALRAFYDRHVPQFAFDGTPVCTGCSDPWPNGNLVTYPCPDVTAIADALTPEATS